MLFSQMRLILLNQTTIESMSTQVMKERDKRALRRLHPWYNCGSVHISDQHPSLLTLSLTAPEDRLESNGMKSGVSWIPKGISGGLEARGRIGKT